MRKGTPSPPRRPRSLDSKDQALAIQALVGGDRFVLVTSASHMPRTVAMFRKVGLDPIPTPTEYLSKTKQSSSIPSAVFPSAGGLAYPPIVITSTDRSSTARK
ncbi:MAG: YdcF family protein [Acidobacteria bacterium]|nr:YdcF family protein [Acidobacteriota bacterium]